MRADSEFVGGVHAGEWGFEASFDDLQVATSQASNTWSTIKFIIQSCLENLILLLATVLWPKLE
jgi:hypothetical protein